MTVFSSSRERRLWAWVGVVLVAIAAAMFVGRPLAGAMRELGLMAPLFLAGMILVAAAVAAVALKWRVGGAEVGVVLATATAYYLVFVRMGSSEERSHLIEYGLVAALIHEALLERASQGRHVPVPAFTAALITTLIGVIDEAVQAPIPGRVFDPQDVVFNTLAAVMAVVAGAALRFARSHR